VPYGIYHEDTEFDKYEKQLYARLLAALTDTKTTDSFVESNEYLARGLALWHALLEDHDSTGNLKNSHSLIPALYSLSRCHTHGMHWTHNSETCKFKASGHKDKATKTNTMGGNQKGLERKTKEESKQE